MTGAYLRVIRNDKYKSIEVEHLTDREREAIFKNRSSEEVIRWLNLVCKELSNIDNDLKQLAEKHQEDMI